MKQIVILACGTRGDVVHLLELASALQRRGNSVWVLTDYGYNADCQKRELRVNFIDHEEDGERLLDDIPDLDSPSRVLRFLEKHIIPRLLRAQSILELADTGERLHLVAMAFFGMVSLLAEKLDATLTTVFTAPDNLYKWQNSLQFVVTAMSQRLTFFCESWNIAPVKFPADLMRYPQQRLAFWPDWFDLESHTSREVQRTGFILPTSSGPSELSPEILLALEASRKPVLITGSTARSANAKRFYEQAITSCDALEEKAIVVAKGRDLLPESLSPGITWIPWISQIALVLPHIPAVIHHGGMGTTGECVRAGAPQLVLADGLDRPTNGRCVQRLGAGRTLLPAQWTIQKITDALSFIVNSAETQHRCRELSNMVGATDSLHKTCELVEKFAAAETTTAVNPAMLASSL